MLVGGMIGMTQPDWLSGEAWTVPEPHLPGNRPGASRMDDRRVINVTHRRMTTSPGISAGAVSLAEQVKLVAGTRNQLDLLLTG